MGEAKRRQRAQQQALLEEMRRWSQPPSESEKDLVEELNRLERHIVPRASAWAMKEMRMEPQQCHLNCLGYVNGDPEGKSRQVLGWMVAEDCYVLHSVVEQDGQLCCITPSVMDSVTAICFIPDPLIEWRDLEDGSSVFVRNGVQVEYGVRMNPEEEIARRKYVISRIESGMPLHVACDLAGYIPPKEI